MIAVRYNLFKSRYNYLLREGSLRKRGGDGGSFLTASMKLFTNYSK